MYLAGEGISLHFSTYNWLTVMQCIIMENTLIKLTLHDETKKRAHDSQIVKAKENLKF